MSSDMQGILLIKESNVGLVVVDEDFVIFAEYRKDGVVYRGKLALMKMFEEEDAIIYPFKLEKETIMPNTLIELQEAYNLTTIKKKR